MEEKRLEFRGSSFCALIPFAIFIVITITLSFFNAADLNMMIGAGVIGLLVGMLFAKNLEQYWDAVLEGLGSKVGMTAVMLWLVVGIYGNILKSGHIVEGLVWLSVKLSVSGAAFTVAAFIFAAIFAMATGSGFGTISTMSFILYPAGILLGSQPAVLAGAILSGAAFGDNLAPVSDTTIIAATSQEYVNKEGTADIGGTVRTRTKFVLVAAAIAIVLFFIFGGAGKSTDSAMAAEMLAQYQNPKGLLLLIPTAIVIFLAIKGVNIFAALGTGIFTAIVIGLASGLFGLSAIVTMKDGNLIGAIPEGVAGMTTVSILLIMVVAMGNLLVKSGCMDKTVDWLNDTVIKSPRGADIAIFSLATIFGILIAAINTIANICVAPFINAVGKKNNLHPYRRANILATAICSFPFFLPFGGCVLLLLGGLSTMMDTYPFLPTLAPTDMMFTAFYSWAIWVVMLVTCITGWDRTFEGKDGEIVREKKQK
ncbi:transporter (NhaC family) [Muricomes intestini]|uniref:Transporter (NhaC family) n=1 Tax=Muricomes intestini TaxID=1796634 RepID=A0A4V2UQV1_9FIRM|nr:Na+/H+ antiporter NhaC family protein [Muricomes intestini]TCS72877.1 transporter (NhaC family) [Muricomes intestini]